MTTKATIETTVITVVTVHGRARLRKGLLARLSFAVITFSCSQPKVPALQQKAYTPVVKGRNRYQTLRLASQAYTLPLRRGFENRSKRKRSNLTTGPHSMPFALQINPA